jgi:YfiH family protein
MSKFLDAINYISYKFLDAKFSIPRTNEQLKQEQLDRAAQSMGIRPKNLVTLRQVHSSRVIIADNNDEALPEADALVSTTKNLALGILTADCVPILLACEISKIIAAVHAGWRGALGGVIENTVQVMRDLKASNVVAALGPCIWQESYEVSQAFYDQARQDDHKFFIKGVKAGHWQFDLPGLVKNRLEQAGVLKIDDSFHNTYTNNNFHSYRRHTHNLEEEYKNNLSYIIMR